MSTELFTLPNLGKTSVQWLNAIGIHSIEQLRNIGAVNAYCKAKKRGFNVSKVFLYSIEGALKQIHWKNLSNEEKQDLLKQADQCILTM